MPPAPSRPAAEDTCGSCATPETARVSGVPNPVLSDFVKAYDVRGVVPDQLNVDVAWALGAAFAQTVVAPEGASGVVIGHDMRPSSPELSRAFAAGVTAQGLDATLIGL